MSIARTLANEPEALLLDEPRSALDEPSAKGIEALVASISRDRGMTCVIVTHNKAQAMRMTSRAMIMEAGRLIAVGPTDKVLA